MNNFFKKIKYFINDFFKELDSSENTNSYYSEDNNISKRRSKLLNFIHKKKIIDSVFKRLLLTCPCCGYPTYADICIICWWQDDGQDDKDAKLVKGGPNGNLTLEQARLNFIKTMNCDGKKLTFKKIKEIKQVTNLFDKALKEENEKMLLKAFQNLLKYDKKISKELEKQYKTSKN